VKKKNVTLDSREYNIYFNQCPGAKVMAHKALFEGLAGKNSPQKTKKI